MESYQDWKALVTRYTIDITRKHPSRLAKVDLKKMFDNRVHPYFAAVKIIVRSRVFSQGRIYQSFVIPKKDKVVLVRVAAE